MKSISISTLLLFVAIASGCATVDLNTEGSDNTAGQPDIMQQLADNSQGK